MFKVPESKMGELAKWMDDQFKKDAARQGKDEPYYGAIGGTFTYQFTPNSLGMTVKVINGLSGDCIDLSDYDNW